MGFDETEIRGVTPAGFPPEVNELSRQVIGAAIEVHKHLGPGLREQMYERILVKEMRLRGIAVGQQVPFHVYYKGDDLGIQVIDLVVKERVVVECKSVSAVTETDKQQALGYAKFAHLPLALLMNFNVARLVDGVTRRINWPLSMGSDAVVVRMGASSVDFVPSL